MTQLPVSLLRLGGMAAFVAATGFWFGANLVHNTWGCVFWDFFKILSFFPFRGSSLSLRKDS